MRNLRAISFLVLIFTLLGCGEDVGKTLLASKTPAPPAALPTPQSPMKLGVADTAFTVRRASPLSKSVVPLGLISLNDGTPMNLKQESTAARSPFGVVTDVASEEQQQTQPADITLLLGAGLVEISPDTRVVQQGVQQANANIVKGSLFEMALRNAPTVQRPLQQMNTNLVKGSPLEIVLRPENASLQQ